MHCGHTVWGQLLKLSLWISFIDRSGKEYLMNGIFQKLEELRERSVIRNKGIW
jgi:hypothetical protein